MLSATAAFKAVVADAVARLEATKGVSDVQSPYGEGQRRSALGGRPLGARDLRAGREERRGQGRRARSPPSRSSRSSHPGYRVEEFGARAPDKALTQAFEDDFQKAEITSLPITLIILILAFRRAARGVRPPGARGHRRGGGDRPDRPDQPDLARGRVDLVARALDRARGRASTTRCSTCAASARSAPADARRKAALEAAAATSGRAVLVSGVTVIIAMAGMYLGGAADLRVLRHRHDPGGGAVAWSARSPCCPAVLSKLGDRVNKGRVPFLRPEKRTGEARAWSWLLDRVLRRRSCR